MTKSLSELEKQLGAAIYDNTKLSKELFARNKQLAAVEKKLQEYKEAMEWLVHTGEIVYDRVTMKYSVYSYNLDDHYRGKTPLLAIQAAMKAMERKGE